MLNSIFLERWGNLIREIFNILKIACNIINFFLCNVVSRTGLHNLSGLDQFDKFVSLAHFPGNKKRRTAYLRIPFHYFQLTSRALTVPLLLPDSEKFLMAVWSPYYSFVNEAHDFALIVHPVYYIEISESPCDLPSEFLWRGSGARCPCFFRVSLACENDSSHFSLFSALPPCNAIFRFHVFDILKKIWNIV